MHIFVRQAGVHNSNMGCGRNACQTGFSLGRKFKFTSRFIYEEKNYNRLSSIQKSSFQASHSLEEGLAGKHYDTKFKYIG